MKKLISLILVLFTAFTLFACSGKENQTGGKKLRIVVTLQSQQINFWSNVQHTMERLAKEENFDLTIMDINSDVSTFANIIDDIVALNPDGVITCGLESSTLTNHVKTLQAAGIPVVTFNISPDEDICPMVVADQVEFGRVAGVAAAQTWQKTHPDVAPVGGAIDLYSAPVCALRVQGFVEGFRSIYPEFALAQTVDGGGSRATSLSAAEDMLEANKEINVIFGINADSALGGLDALREINRGTIADAIVASVDGTEADCAELKDPDSALKAVAGNSPRIMSEMAWDLLKQVINGTLPATKGYQATLEVVAVTAETAEEWATTNFE